MKKRVLINFIPNPLGDNISMSPYYEIYRQKHDVDLTVACNHFNLFEKEYPEIKFISKDNLDRGGYDEVRDVTYYFEEKPMQEIFSKQIGLDPYEEVRPKVTLSGRGRPHGRKYVVIATQTTMQNKYWNYPGGWASVIKMLKEKKGLDVICIDRFPSFGIAGWFNQVPEGAIDRTGVSLDDVINYIEHAEFFMGVSTGPTWLAHACGKHTVMVSGATKEWCEYSIDVTRVINKAVCNGCFNNNDYKFDPGNWLWCPEHEGTENHFVCTKQITPEMVWEKMKESKIV
jgi:autotransporter strand-loop-strand O-heptosyltransferase